MTPEDLAKVERSYDDARVSTIESLRLFDAASAAVERSRVLVEEAHRVVTGVNNESERANGK